jgi:hypothetical protein
MNHLEFVYLEWTEADVDLHGQHQPASPLGVEIARDMCKTGREFGQMTERHPAKVACLENPSKRPSDSGLMLAAGRAPDMNLTELPT